MTETQQTLGAYTLRQVIGRGGMSTVFEAEDERTGRRVAIKVMSVKPGLTAEDEAAFLARIQREVRAATRLAHPNIVTVFDVGQQGRDYYIVMELLDGKTLRQWLDSHGPRTPAEFAPLLDQIAGGLDAIHTLGIVHRDLKSSNVMLTELESGRPHVTILDFGVARSDTDTTVTQKGMMVGTPTYLAPELVMGAKADAASDRWALGVLLYETLTGRKPFVGDATGSMFHKIVHEPPAPTPELPTAVQDVLRKALAPLPEDRFGSGCALATAFRDALILPAGSVHPLTSSSVAPTIVAPLPVIVAPAAPVATAPARRRQNFAVPVLLTVLGVGLIVGATRFLQAPPASPSASAGRVLSPTPPAPVKKVAKKPAKAVPARVTTAKKPAPARTMPRKPRGNPRLPVSKGIAPRKSVVLPTAAKPAPTRNPIPSPTPLTGILVPYAYDGAPQQQAPPSREETRPEAPPVNGKRAKESEPLPGVIEEVFDKAPGNAAVPEGEIREDLRAFLNGWISASVRQDVAGMMEFYPGQLERYYTLLNVSSEHVRRDKDRIFSPARRVEMSVSGLNIFVGADHNRAILRYRKDYRIVGGAGARQGAVLEELRVRREGPGDDWNIYFERNPKVLGR